MKFNARYYLGVLTVLILAIPVWASSNSSHRDSTDYDVTQTVTVGNTQLQPGHYTIEAREMENQVEVLQNGKVVATAPCHWVKLPQKASDSEISTAKNQVNEIQFRGRDEAVKLG